jgi:uncharacterized SAM-binding protein YcdF (DUF218 family)
MKKFLIVSAIIVTPVLILFASLLIYIGNKAHQDTKIKSDVILVLGSKAYSGTDCFGPRCMQGFVPSRHYNPCLVARVNQAVSLYKDHYAPKILMSGGTDKENNVTEAETMKKIANEAGVPEADILIEKQSASTYENFTLSQKIINDMGLRSVIIVSDPYHNARAELVAAKLHYKYSLSPTINSPCSNQTFREAWALIGYKLSGKI